MTLKTDIISYYKCDTDWSFPDAAGSNDWTINGSIFNASGKINWCYSFDGANDMIQIDNQISLSSEFSIRLYVKFDNRTKACSILSKRDWLGINNYTIATDATNLKMIVRHSWWTYTHIYAISNFDNINWFHLIYTYSVSDWYIKLYINSVNVWTNFAISNAMLDSDVPTRLADNFYSTFFPWDIDELAFRGRALTSTDVTELEDLQYPFWIMLSNALMFWFNF